MVVARFEGHVHRPSLGRVACHAERFNLRMGLTRRLGKPSAHDYPVFDNHRAHRWIWAGMADRMLSCVEGQSHIICVG